MFRVIGIYTYNTNIKNNLYLMSYINFVKEIVDV